DAVANYAKHWRTLAGRMDERRYREVLAQLEYQSGQAEVWRDAVVNWFLKESGIPDAQGRAGKHPGRWEVEAMQLSGYKVIDVTFWEAASGKAVSCTAAVCTATLAWDGPAGWYDIRVRYFDQNNGAARFRVRVGGQVVD